MAQRPIWRGHLRLALVSCPVALYTAQHAREALHFNLINPATGNRIRMVTQDAETGEELRRSDLVKGYEFEKHRYLLLDDDDFESARTETSTIMKVDKFVPAGSIDPVYFDASYYMAPDGGGADDVYAVLREAIVATGHVALSRVTMARRERAVLITPMEGGLAVHTLLEERDLNKASDVFKGALSHAPDTEMVALAKQLIARQVGAYDPTDVEDRYETRLRAVIDAKLEGQGVVPEEAPAAREGNVIDLMAALKQSLGDASTKGAAAAAAKQAAKRVVPPVHPRRLAGLRPEMFGVRLSSSFPYKAASQRRPAERKQSRHDPRSGQTGRAGKPPEPDRWVEGGLDGPCFSGGCAVPSQNGAFSP